VEFRILGPIEVEDGPRTLSLDAPKQRTLLGVLLLHPNEVVSAERLIDELWGEQPPTTAAKVLRTYVSQLRGALGAGAIGTHAPGYVLRVDDEALDAARFHRLIGEGRRLAASGEHERAAAAYGEALALWRGPALDDVVFESFARNEAERLEEERLSALMERIDCDLALGRHEELLAELEPLVKQYPLRERLRAQLMLALYRSGRQVDALAVYQETRRMLLDELGLEPGPQLHDLERAILTHDQALAAPPPRTPPAAAPKPTARQPRRLLLVLAPAATLVLALGLAAALRGEHPSAKLLATNSVGFIDAASGRVTRAFPAGRTPVALAVTKGSLWVANYRQETVTRIDSKTGRAVDVIPVGGHPTSLVSFDNKIWVWTLENSLVKIEPRFETASAPIQLAVGATAGTSRGGRAGEPAGGGSIAAAAGYLWVTAPGTTVIRVDPAHPERRVPIVPDDGAEGPIATRDGNVWVAGTSRVFPIAGDTRIPGAGIDVGAVYDLTFGAGTLWVVSGAPMHAGAAQALRRLDLRDRIVDNTIQAGNNPIRVASSAGSIWVASRTDATVYRIDRRDNRIAETIPVGSTPSALAPARDGIWVATG
jgi:DNA-binding SARP family transcriptional activator/streptogramin lyase